VVYVWRGPDGVGNSRDAIVGTDRGPRPTPMLALLCSGHSLRTGATHHMIPHLSRDSVTRVGICSSTDPCGR
jgi:hypothetical protein